MGSILQGKNSKCIEKTKGPTSRSLWNISQQGLDKLGRLTADAVIEALSLEGIDEAGLDELDRRVLRTILKVYRGGAVGIEALAATLNEEPDTLSDLVEPFLLKCEFLVRTPQGRRVTDAGRRHLRQAPMGSDDVERVREGPNSSQERLTFSPEDADGRDIPD